MTEPLDRRAMLRLAGGAVCAAAIGPLARHASVQADEVAATRTMPFGFSLYGLRGMPLVEAIELCRGIGYDAVELAALPDFPAEPRRFSAEDRVRVRKALDANHVSLPSLMDNLPVQAEDAAHRQQLDRLKAVIDLGHDLLPDRPPLVETVLGGKPGGWDSVKTLFVERLGDWARLGAETRTVIAIKPHRMNALNTPVDALWLLDQVNNPWLRLVYDYSHFEFRDFPLADTVRQLAPRSAMAHVKDTVLDGDKARFVLPGDGSTDYAALLAALAAAGFGGCVMVEPSAQVFNKPGYDGPAAARHCYERLAPRFTAAGVRRPGA